MQGIVNVVFETTVIYLICIELEMNLLKNLFEFYAKRNICEISDFDILKF